MGYSPIHMNQNLVCAIDTETTGLFPGVHDIIQLSIIPLGPDYEMSKEFRPFDILMVPKRPENIDPNADKVNKGKLTEALNYGLDPWTAVERFDEWFQALRLPFRKLIIPLGHNFMNFDRAFIVDWLGGPQSYNQYFHHGIRDSMGLALSINDMAEWHSEKIPFPKVNLAYLANRLGINLNRAHNATDDALASAGVYKRLLRWKGAFAPTIKGIELVEVKEDESK